MATSAVNEASYRGFVFTFLVTGIGLLLLVVAFALVIDPYGLSPIQIGIPGVNTAKVERISHDRLIKPYEALAIAPQTIIVGTSRVKQAFDPDAAPAELGRVYNAGVDA